jgi:hypothetical protein
LVLASVLPPNRISPPSTGIRPAMRLMSVDLPQPLGPKIDTNSPRAMSTSKRS